MKIDAVDWVLIAVILSLLAKNGRKDAPQEKAIKVEARDVTDWFGVTS